MHRNRTRLAAIVAAGLVLTLVLVVVAVVSWVGQRSREAHEAQLADKAAWNAAIADTAWLSSMGLNSAQPRTPCSVEDEAPGRLEWTFTGRDWPRTSASIRTRLVSEGWTEAPADADGYIAMSRMTSERPTSLSLPAKQAPAGDMPAVLELSPLACPLR